MTSIHHPKIGILGCTGRVGSLLINELRGNAWPQLSLAGGTTRGAGGFGSTGTA